MTISSRTPEGESRRCPVCGSLQQLDPSSFPTRDAPCACCGSLLWFATAARSHSAQAVPRATSSVRAPLSAAEEYTRLGLKIAAFLAVEYIAFCVLFWLTAPRRLEPTPSPKTMLVQVGKEELPGSIYGRHGPVRDKLLRGLGGKAASEEAVRHGLCWLARQQTADGRWALDGEFPDRGPKNDVAGTAFGLLPFLGAGCTHKPTPGNPYDKHVQRGLSLLMRQQERGGCFGGGMYAHGLATIAVCEAYGLTRDATLRDAAQHAVNYIVSAQHSEGGWRYSPGQPGDTSVTGWQVLALLTGRMAGLYIPETTLRKARNFLEGMCDPDNQGYRYNGPEVRRTTTAIALLCRQYLDAWGPRHPRLQRAIVLLERPDARNMYHHYFATQVLRHMGGDAWTRWNARMRDDLIGRQDRGPGPLKGSWSSHGEPHQAGRLMMTSLCLQTLQVYYRHVPLKGQHR